MKNFLITLAIGLSPALLSAQLLPPVDLNVFIEYVGMDGPGWTDCNGAILSAPDYCTRFSWTCPDTVTHQTKIECFNIYRDNLLFTTVSGSTSYAIRGAFPGDFYITAYYSDPEGESEASNIVNVPDDLPIGVEFIRDETTIYFNPITRCIETGGSGGIYDKILLYDLSGKMILELEGNRNVISGSIQDGIYLAGFRGKQLTPVFRKVFIY